MADRWVKVTVRCDRDMTCCGIGMVWCGVVWLGWADGGTFVAREGKREGSRDEKEMKKNVDHLPNPWCEQSPLC